MSDDMNFIFCSEFSNEGYNKSFIEKCVESAMDIPDDEASITRMTAFFNEYRLLDRLKTVSWNRNAYLQSSFYRDMLELLDMLELDMVNDIGYNSKAYTVKFTEELMELRKTIEIIPENSLYVDELSLEYLFTFFHLSARAVFNPDNNNLNNIVFRKSETLEQIYCIGRMLFQRKKALNTPKQNNEGYSYYNICNPFALDSLRRVIYNTAKDRKRFSRIISLRPLRVSILENQALRAFTRFTSYDNFLSYKVELNRHNSEIISVPYNKLSSIEAVKPIRLFEKTVTYIHKRIMDRVLEPVCNELNINILFIGHTEESLDTENKYDDRELYDWIYAVLAWYDRSFNHNDYPSLNLYVTHILSDGDFCSSLEKENYRRNSFEGNYNLHHFRVGIKTVDYKSEFYFSTERLKNYCDDNDLIFIIDCPWLTVESYELKIDVSLSMYSHRIQELEILFSKDIDWLDSEQQTTMQELDTQFNRITSSESSMHGDISRVFRDGILTDINDIISNNKCKIRKELYVFTSESDGVDYSFLGSYPLTRTELYGGKRFTISMFSNVTPSRLQVAQKPELFVIKLWSILKYISISYAFTAFKESIYRIIEKYIQKPEQYFELYRDILVIIEPERSLKELTVSVRFSDRIGVLFQEMGIDRENSNFIKKKLFDLIYHFIYTLYTEAVFSEHNDFGDNFIKTGFEMNLASNARDVNAMLFIHEYHKAVDNHQTNCYILHWKEKYNPVYYKDENYIHEFFMDKELYSILLNNLEHNDHLSIGTIAMLNQSNKIYHTPAMAYRLMNNIITAYEMAGIDNINIIQNTRRAIEQLD